MYSIKVLLIFGLWTFCHGTPLSGTKALIDNIYDSCTDKTCMGCPAGCLESKDCESVVAITPTSGTNEMTTFEVIVNHATGKWVAICLSDDEDMSDDNCMQCMYDGTKVLAKISRTTTATNDDDKDVAIEVDQSSMTLASSSYVDNQLYCKMNRKNTHKMDDGKRTYDLVNDEYHLLLGAGTEVNGVAIKEHDLQFRSSTNKAKLSDVSAFSSASKINFEIAVLLTCIALMLKSF